MANVRDWSRLLGRTLLNNSAGFSEHGHLFKTRWPPNLKGKYFYHHGPRPNICNLSNHPCFSLVITFKIRCCFSLVNTEEDSLQHLESGLKKEDDPLTLDR